MSRKKRARKPPAAKKAAPQRAKPRLCIECPHARFPTPNEQCYKFGGLVCTKYNINVGKYDVCCEEREREKG